LISETLDQSIGGHPVEAGPNKEGPAAETMLKEQDNPTTGTAGGATIKSEPPVIKEEPVEAGEHSEEKRDPILSLHTNGDHKDGSKYSCIWGNFCSSNSDRF